MLKLLMTVLASFFLTVSVGSFAAQTSGAELVQSDAHGGWLRLSGAHVPAMADAQKLMAAHCAGGFEHAVLDEIVEFQCAPSASQQHEPCAELALRAKLAK